MPWSVDHGPHLIRMSVGSFSHFLTVSMMAARAAILKVFNCYLRPNPVRWSGNLMEGIRAAWRFRIAKMVLF